MLIKLIIRGETGYWTSPVAPICAASNLFEALQDPCSDSHRLYVKLVLLLLMATLSSYIRNLSEVILNLCKLCLCSNLCFRFVQLVLLVIIRSNYQSNYKIKLSKIIWSWPCLMLLCLLSFSIFMIYLSVRKCDKIRNIGLIAMSGWFIEPGSYGVFTFQEWCTSEYRTLCNIFGESGRGFFMWDTQCAIAQKCIICVMHTAYVCRRPCTCICMWRVGVL